MSAAAKVIDLITEDERRDLFAVYLNCPALHERGFDEALKCSLILGCLRATVRAKKRALAERAAAAQLAAQNFQLTS